MEKLIFVFALFASAFSFVPGNVAAVECSDYCSALGTKTPLPQPDNTTCICNPLNTEKFTEVVDRILDILFFVSLAVAPIMVIAAGFQFLTGGGNPQKISAGKQILIWTAVGFLLILLSKGIILVLKGVVGF